MAEVNDVQFKMAGDIAAIIVPLVGTTYSMPEYIDANGATQPTADVLAYGSDRTVPPTLIAPLRPKAADIKSRLSAGKATISLECGTHDAPCPQYTNKPDLLISKPEPTLTYTQSDFTVLLGGSVTPGNVIGLQIGDVSTSYLVKAGDTLDTISAGLAAAAPGDGFYPITTFEGGFTVNAPTGVPPMIVTVGVTSTWIRPVQYRKRFFDALIWASNPYDRQFFGRQLAQMYDLGQRLPMTDGSVATVMDCQGAIDHDDETPDNLFLRRVRWVIDFITIRTFTKTTIVATLATLNAVPFGTDLADFSAPTASQL